MVGHIKTGNHPSVADVLQQQDSRFANAKTDRCKSMQFSVFLTPRKNNRNHTI